MRAAVILGAAALVLSSAFSTTNAQTPTCPISDYSPGVDGCLHSEANCGRERVRGLYNLCRSHEAMRAASPVHEQRGDVDHHRLPLLVFFRRQHGEGLAPLQSIDCTFHQRLLFC